MESITEDILPRVIPHPTQVAHQFVDPVRWKICPINSTAVSSHIGPFQMPANNFQPITCVPEVSLLDPNEIMRCSSDDKISYKLWKKHKILPVKSASVQALELPAPTNILDRTPPAPPALPMAKCCEDRIGELTSAMEQQQTEIDRLRTDNTDMRRDLDDMRNNFQTLSLAMHELRSSIQTGRSDTPGSLGVVDPFSAPSGRWSLPGDSSEPLCSRTEGVLTNSNGTGRAPPDKSQMMNNLYKKYFSPSTENVSPTNFPILEYPAEADKSMATVNYLNKYKLLNTNERVLDISKLKRQSKLKH